MLEVRVSLRCLAGQSMELAHRNAALALRRAYLHHRVERGERNRHVRRMNRDAALASTEDRMHAIVSFARSAPRAGRALVAFRERGVVEVMAARALQQIPAHG